MAKQNGSRGQDGRKKRDVMERDCHEAASLYLRGKSYQQIADELELSRDAVRRRITHARKLWRKRASRTYQKHLYEQMARLDELETQAWRGWELSLKDALETATEDGETPKGPIDKTTVRRKKQSGNASFLKIIHDTVRQRSELLGLLDEDARNQGGADDDVGVVSVVIESREEAEEIQTLSLSDYKTKLSEAAEAG